RRLRRRNGTGGREFDLRSGCGEGPEEDREEEERHEGSHAATVGSPATPGKREKDPAFEPLRPHRAARASPPHRHRISSALTILPMPPVFASSSSSPSSPIPAARPSIESRPVLTATSRSMRKSRGRTQSRTEPKSSIFPG